MAGKKESVKTKEKREVNDGNKKEGRMKTE